MSGHNLELLMFSPWTDPFWRQYLCSWSYVLEAVMHCVEDEGMLVDSTRRKVDMHATVVPGRYIYLRPDDASQVPSYRRGPEGKTPFKPPGASQSSGTRSDSKRSSHTQSRFREALIYRDQDCLLTGVRYRKCTPAHIVPFSRGSEPYLFRPDMGLLLADDLHHAFDHGDWALYPRESDYVVHFFDTDHSQDRK